MIVTDPREVTDWVMEQQGEIPSTEPLPGIGWKQDGKMTAGMLWERHTGTDVSVHVSCDGSMPRQWLVDVARLLFTHLQVKRVSFPIVEGNDKCVELAKHFGAKLDYRIAQGHRLGDILVYCLWRNTGFHQRLVDAGKLKD